ncbi:Retrotransposon gag protein [Gossypium australe]|uniref:Retrotransposon gag protein n=1 Tax=Gossypium australe TaxID=47621 RepID=A0A5B6WGZ5_9ROSI|nr:Retrotransposon gag protein [Gossypium australe]
MDFVSGLPLSPKKKDVVWVVRYEIYIAVLGKNYKKFGYEVEFYYSISSANRWLILEDMLCSCVLEFEGNWERFLPLVEFAYNNNFQLSIKMAPYEALYGRKSQTLLY